MTQNTMTLTEKREALIKKIQKMPEAAVDKLLAALAPPAEEQVEKRQQEVEAIIKNDFKRYHNVFKALS
ncbi:hypothetical protein [Hugenholtzia roseola]|uniref:hypothetical protein n=1 Tax=Hugenholtzia roseola TaxID=1002 RepID=UPI00047B75E1|nr:hypothetical protein [Hugenholtzia roseola]